ncbi:uncharacterized protein LOC132316630 [Cornus florida]|uniref:uncharacterized protein LOC132316630 n=1 Tax=Cornus florida TaxID=4283 RepID=UPI00289A626F|nr:uncharacterized protein LOC132316630 [Cornus florida]
MGCMSDQIKVAKDNLYKIQMEMLLQPVNQESINSEREASSHRQHVLDIEEIMWAQKSRVKWIKERDRWGILQEDMPARKSLSQEESYVLDSGISVEEIKGVVMGFSSDKAPRLVGFLARFFQKYWSVVGANVLKVVLFFFNNKNFLKIIAKILANRLSEVLPNLIGQEQVAFIKNRRLHDNILLVSDLVKDFGKKFGEANMTLKVDLKKAYDSVEWVFILSRLKAHGFSN